MRSLGGAMVLCALLAIGRAEAQPDKTIAEAKQHFRTGNQLYDTGRYGEAAAEYEIAFRLTDRAEFLFNMGQAYRLAGNAKAAKAAYQGYLRRVPDAPQRHEIEQYFVTLNEAIRGEAAKPVAPPTTSSPASPPPQAPSTPAASVYNPWGAPGSPSTSAMSSTSATPAMGAVFQPRPTAVPIPSIG